VESLGGTLWSRIPQKSGPRRSGGSQPNRYRVAYSIRWPCGSETRNRPSPPGTPANCRTGARWREICKPADGKQLLLRPQDAAEVGRLRQTTRTGRLCGDASFGTNRAAIGPASAARRWRRACAKGRHSPGFLSRTRRRHAWNLTIKPGACLPPAKTRGRYLLTARSVVRRENRVEIWPLSPPVATKCPSGLES
jgi:hypothetical protein